MTPILEIIDDDEMSAYFGVLEGTIEYDQLSKIESEIVSIFVLGILQLHTKRKDNTMLLDFFNIQM